MSGKQTCQRCREKKRETGASPYHSNFGNAAGATLRNLRACVGKCAPSVRVTTTREIGIRVGVYWYLFSNLCTTTREICITVGVLLQERYV